MGFNLIWALSIFIGNDALLWIAVLLLLHFVFVAKSWIELPIVLVVALVGYSVDYILTIAGVFRFEQAQGITPVWLFFLWIGFCSTLRYSLHFFSEKYRIASIAGAIAGCVTYFSAAHFGAVELPLAPVISAAILAGVWALLFPALLWISHTMSQYLSKHICL
ncbi:DUF2878 domain-containing protein [Neptunomonas antarctica]|nr:DUF2878 domain-containing protein [Neptunomonas antarctica]